MLEVHGLSKHYRSGGQQQIVFDQLDLVIEAQQIVALVGASGSGKTTLLNLLSGIDQLDAGQVFIDGEDIHAQQEPLKTLTRRLKLGFVFQFFNLIPTLTVAENIALPMELAEFDPTDIEERVDWLLQRVGLDTTHARYPETLSGGEQQRIALARALSHRPRLLLADEPTGNLDEDTGESIMTLMTQLARDEGMTMLIVTHSRSVAAVADRILRLQQGKLTAT